MPAPNEATRRDAAPNLVTANRTLGMPLNCPECGAVGWVDWKSLKHGIGCPECGCQFIIGRNGQLISQADLHHTRFTCPRCKHAGALPTVVCGRGANCPGCKLPLALGPDQRLHEAEKAAELWRASSFVAPRAADRSRLAKLLIAENGHVRRWGVAACLAMLVPIALAGAAALRWFFDNSPEKTARKFAYVCLAGEWNSALAYMADDAVQRAFFERWRSRHFTSIRDSFRPSGDRVRVEVEVLKSDDNLRVMCVTMKSPFIGTRKYVQHWRERDGQWLFDARETLVGQEPRRPTSRGGPLPRRTSALDGRQSRPATGSAATGGILRIRRSWATEIGWVLRNSSPVSL